jgi:uncharacterized membrane protein
MRRQLNVILLLGFAVALAAVANLGGNIIQGQLPAVLQANALSIFCLATLAEFITSIFLDRLEKMEWTPLRQVRSICLISAGTVAAALGGLVSNDAAAALPDEVRPYIVPNVLLLLIIVTVFTIIVAVVLFRFADTRLTPDNRARFLRKVHERYTNRMLRTPFRSA